MVHWFKRHPQHLVKESSALSGDTNYKELFQFRNNLFISHGIILVRLEEIHRFPILIVYPEATPYALPLIYPLKHQLSEKEVESLSHESHKTLGTKIAPLVHFYYHLRHQNKSGNICILEWDNLDDGSKFYGIATILKRIRDWYSGIVTDNFPPDTQEVEFCAHFNNIDHYFRLLYSDTFLNREMIEGEAFASLSHQVSVGKYQEQRKLVYVGNLILGKNTTGIITASQIPLPQVFITHGISSIVELNSKSSIVNQLVEEKKILKILWYQIEKEPPPFETFKELIKIVGNGNYESGFKRMLPQCLDVMKLKPTVFFVAIRFPNRRGGLDFQLFKVCKKQNPLSSLLNVPDAEIFKSLVDSYETVYAIYSENFTDQSFHERNSTRSDRNILKNKIVNIIGSGALGGEIADSISKAGIGSLTLIDNQELKANNTVRHIAGLNYVGVDKVMAVANILNAHNPFVNYNVSNYDILSMSLEDKSYDNSVSISSIADDNIEGYLNEKALESGRIIYYVRALRGGKVARIFRVIPGVDACFNCLSIYHEEEKEYISIPEDENLPTLRTECNNPIRPASAADLKLISALASRIILDELQNGPQSSNHWIWTTETIGTITPYSLHSQSFSPHPNCYYCNHEKKIQVFLPTEIQNFMKGLIFKNPNIETGGVLAGHINDDGNFIITHASDPGPKAVQQPITFIRDNEYCQKFLNDLFLKSGKKVVYLGEWHSHPSKNNQPSGTDIKSLTEISLEQNYLTDKPVMIIFSNEGTPSCTIHPAGKVFYFAELLSS